MRHYTADEVDAGMRLDMFVYEQLQLLSRAAVQRLCQSGQVIVNGEPVKNGYKLKPGDCIDVRFDEKSLDIPDIELPVIYEDDDCIVIHKPEGVLTHSKGPYNPEATVASFIRSRLRDLEGNRAGIVHRLDRGTSGLIICAKHPVALKLLQKQFADRKAKKSYLAIVSGMLAEREALIDMPIGRHPRKPQIFRTSRMGKSAQTHYTVRAEKPGYSLVDLRPQTGRTHQLRVHLAHIGHPIAGDRLYNGPPAERLMLHACSLEITLPDRQRRTFSAEPPASFMHFWERQQ